MISGTEFKVREEYGESGEATVNLAAQREPHLWVLVEVSGNLCVCSVQSVVTFSKFSCIHFLISHNPCLSTGFENSRAVHLVYYSTGYHI